MNASLDLIRNEPRSETDLCAILLLDLKVLETSIFNHHLNKTSRATLWLPFYVVLQRLGDVMDTSAPTLNLS